LWWCPYSARNGREHDEIAEMFTDLYPDVAVPKNAGHRTSTDEAGSCEKPRQCRSPGPLTRGFNKSGQTDVVSSRLTRATIDAATTFT
jgi:hypothetical protein